MGRSYRADTYVLLFSTGKYYFSARCITIDDLHKLYRLEIVIVVCYENTTSDTFSGSSFYVPTRAFSAADVETCVGTVVVCS